MLLFSHSVTFNSFVFPGTAGCQASLSFITSQSLLKLMSIETMMLSNHLILCCPLLLLLLIFPNIRVFSSESALCILWPKYWSFIFSVSPSNEYSGLISFRLTGLIFLLSKGLSRVFCSTIVQKHQFFSIQPSSANFHICTWLYIPLLVKWCLCFLICCLGLAFLFNTMQSIFTALKILYTLPIHFSSTLPTITTDLLLLPWFCLPSVLKILSATGLLQINLEGLPFCSCLSVLSICLHCLLYYWASLVAQMAKHLSVMQETRVWYPHQEDPLKKEMATHSSILAWKIPWTEEPGGLQSMGSQRVRHDWVKSLSFHILYFRGW